MTTSPVNPQLALGAAGELTLFDSLARLVPDELQTEYYRVLAHTRSLSPNDEMLRVLEAMGILTLLTCHTPKDIARERQRFQELLELHRRHSAETQQKTHGYVNELEARIAKLPAEIQSGIAPQHIAKMLGESLRQHFLQSGIPESVQGLHATGAALTSAQKELSSALRRLSDSQSGIVAQVDYASNRLTYSLESRAKTIDTFLHEWKNDVLRLWIPLIAGAAMLIGLIAGITIKGCRDRAASKPSSPTTASDQVEFHFASSDHFKHQPVT
ncbi:MAG: hypothetical protein ACRD3S_01700 [Terracidiphilus sp.]